jgi:hypothetical protein
MPRPDLKLSTQRFAGMLGASLLALLYGWVAYTSPGYDDEIPNMILVESHGLLDLITYVNRTDVHPPGSYVINWLLYAVLHDWQGVRLLSSLYAAGGIWCFFRTCVGVSGPLDRLFGYLTICLAPTMLLWLTSLRWYSYFLPTLLYIICALERRQSSWSYYATLWLGVAILLHLGYAALVIVAPLAAYAIWRRGAGLKDDLVRCATFGLVAAFICVPQLIDFLHYHLPNSSSQTSNLTRSVAGLGLQLLCGQACFPFSLLGVISILANGMALSLAVRSRNVRALPWTPFLAAEAVMFVCSRLAGKVRNLTLLAPFQGMVTTRTFADSESRPVRALLFLLFAVANLGGIANVARHVDTTKGGWNTPYAQVLEALRREADTHQCRQVVLVASDPVVQYDAAKKGYRVARERLENFPPVAALAADECVARVSTFRGSLTPEQYEHLFSPFDRLPQRAVSVQQFGRDPFAAIKRHMDPAVPDYYVTLSFFRGPVSSDLTSGWSFEAPPLPSPR